MRSSILLLTVVLSAALCGCQQLPGSSETSTIRVASDAKFPPFHFEDDDGKVTGHDIELARAVLERAGFRVEVEVVRPYSALLNGLIQGRYQMVAATTGITPERQRRMLFSTPYFTTCQAAVVRAGDAEPQALADLQGQQVGATGSGTSARAVENMTGVVRVILPQGTDGLASLTAGDIDALIIDEFEAVTAARESAGRLRVLPEPVALEHYGLVMARDAHGLKLQVDRALELLRRNGTLERLRKEFGVDRGEDWPVMWPQ